MSLSLGEVGSRRRLWRSRCGAIGAAVPVAPGGGGTFSVQAASGLPASVVTIDPFRILDTRTNVGLAGPFVSATMRQRRSSSTPTESSAKNEAVFATIRIAKGRTFVEGAEQ